MKVAQLKDLCKEAGLKISGKKAELQQRLREHFLKEARPCNEESDDIDSMSDEDLRHALSSRCLPTDGSRSELLKRYKEDLEFVADVKKASSISDTAGYATMSEILDAAAKKDGSVISEYLEEIKSKQKEESKFIDVTITSLGLEPEKFTAGGGPSVTADVIRNLAGDPFADPPRYGSVSPSE